VAPKALGFRSAQNSCWPMKKRNRHQRISIKHPNKAQRGHTCQDSSCRHLSVPATRPLLDLEEPLPIDRRLDRTRTYARPVTVVDRKTHYSMEATRPSLISERTARPAFGCAGCVCVDTCQMWCSGLGLAMNRADRTMFYWLIPGDFNYGRLSDGRSWAGCTTCRNCLELQQDLCIGEIATDTTTPSND